jgi:hypothetical protein
VLFTTNEAARVDAGRATHARITRSTVRMRDDVTTIAEDERRSSMLSRGRPVPESPATATADATADAT